MEGGLKIEEDKENKKEEEEDQLTPEEKVLAERVVCLKNEEEYKALVTKKWSCILAKLRSLNIILNLHLTHIMTLERLGVFVLGVRSFDERNRVQIQLFQENKLVEWFFISSEASPELQTRLFLSIFAMTL